MEHGNEGLGGGGGDAGLGGVQMTGIVNALKTGNVVLDMAIAMTIPLVLKITFNVAGNAQRAVFAFHWSGLWRKYQKFHERTIEHVSVRTCWGNRSYGDEDSHNDVLIKAIKLFVHAGGFLRLKNADMNLTTISANDDDDDDSYNGNGDGSSKSYAGMLSAMKLVLHPPEEVWHEIGTFGAKNDPRSFYCVSMRISEESENMGGEGSSSEMCTNTIKLRSRGEKSIEAFVKAAYDWYVGEMKKLDDDSRYMYEIVSDRADDNSHARTYKRYKLSDEKTFESLFFREKNRLLGVVQNFLDKSGKYAIKGYPYKLGLLLHGPPGTGKTSFIKALAHRTGRSIVNVPLEKIVTNSELMSIFFDGKYQVDGESVPFKLDFKDVIFVLEDVDAASKIVHRRDGKKTADVTYTEHVELPPPKSLWRLFLESPNDTCRELVPLLMEKSKRLREEAIQMLPTLAQRPLRSVPGLSVFGEGGACNGGGASSVMDKISEQAVDQAKKILDDYDTVDSFLGIHAGAIKAVIDAGAKVDESLEDVLLGLSPADAGGKEGESSFFPPLPGNISRDVSYKKYAEDSDVHVEVSRKGEDMVNDLAALLSAKTGNAPRDSQAKTPGILSEANITTSKKGSPLLAGGFLKGSTDKLNLSGLLNVLDGVVDTPGRIVIMTTNHPEMLDPALIRPGRIDKKLMLGYMHPADVSSMIEHYFQEDLNLEQQRRVEVAIVGDEAGHRPAVNLTPAQVEQFACEWSDVEDMICAIERKGEPLKTQKRSHVSSSDITFDT